MAVSLPGIVFGLYLVIFKLWDDSETSKRQSVPMCVFSEVCFILTSQTAYLWLVSNNLAWWQAKGTLVLTLGTVSFVVNHVVVFRMWSLQDFVAEKLNNLCDLETWYNRYNKAHAPEKPLLKRVFWPISDDAGKLRNAGEVSLRFMIAAVAFGLPLCVVGMIFSSMFGYSP